MPDRFISSVKRNRRRWPWIAAGGVLVLAGAAIAAYFAFVKKQGDYNNPSAAFDTQPTAPPQNKPKPKPETFKGPQYGYPRDRTRFLAAHIHPPFNRICLVRPGKGLSGF